jgi:hypothetical protein
VRIDGHAVGLGAIKHREFEIASGELTYGQFVEFLKSIFQNATHFSMDGAIHFICMDWRHLHEIMEAGDAVYSELKNLCVWNKDNAGMGSFYRSKHELVFAWKVGKGRHVNNIELGSKGSIPDQRLGLQRRQYIPARSHQGFVDASYRQTSRA